jgi:hypothetical protein
MPVFGCNAVQGIDFCVRFSVTLVPAFANDAVFVYHHCPDQGIGGYLTSAATGEFEAALEVRAEAGVLHVRGFFERHFDKKLLSKT